MAVRCTRSDIALISHAFGEQLGEAEHAAVACMRALNLGAYLGTSSPDVRIEARERASARVVRVAGSVAGAGPRAG